jgi:Flp pilus assembly pilin Flp
MIMNVLYRFAVDQRGAAGIDQALLVFGLAIAVVVSVHTLRSSYDIDCAPGSPTPSLCGQVEGAGSVRSVDSTLP